MVPATRPQQTASSSLSRLTAAGVKIDEQHPLAILGVRGYYLRTMGDPNANDRGIYDDALFVVSLSGVVAFNANVDPSVARKGIAVLQPGVYRYGLGVHRGQKAQYPAIVQVGPVIVARDGGGLDTDDPAKGRRFGINIHKGGNQTTSSEGCQTLPPAQWAAFYQLVKGEATRYGVQEFPYVLVNG